MPCTTELPFWAGTPLPSAPSAEEWRPRLALGVGGNLEAWLTFLSPPDPGWPSRPHLSRSHSAACCPILLVSAGHSHDSGLDIPLSSGVAFGSQSPSCFKFVPYYRSPGGLHISPGPPRLSTVGPGVHRKAAQAQGSHTVRSRSWWWQEPPADSPQYLMISTQEGSDWGQSSGLSLSWDWSWPGTLQPPGLHFPLWRRHPSPGSPVGLKEDPAPY